MQQMNQTQILNTQTEIIEDELAKMEYFDSGQWNWMIFCTHTLQMAEEGRQGGGATE